MRLVSHAEFQVPFHERVGECCIIAVDLCPSSPCPSTCSPRRRSGRRKSNANETGVPLGNGVVLFSDPRLKSARADAVQRVAGGPCPNRAESRTTSCVGVLPSPFEVPPCPRNFQGFV